MGYVYRLDNGLGDLVSRWQTTGEGDAVRALTGLGGVGGLALGYSVTFLVELSLLLVILRRRWGDIDGRALALTTLRTVAATVVMAVAVLVVDAGLGAAGFHDAGTLRTAIRVAVLAGTGGVTFVGAGLLVGIHELRDLPAMVLRRTPKTV